MSGGFVCPLPLYLLSRMLLIISLVPILFFLGAFFALYKLLCLPTLPLLHYLEPKKATQGVPNRQGKQPEHLQTSWLPSLPQANFLSYLLGLLLTSRVISLPRRHPRRERKPMKVGEAQEGRPRNIQKAKKAPKKVSKTQEGRPSAFSGFC